MSSKEIIIKDSNQEKICTQLSKALNGSVSTISEETIIDFDSDLGKGKIISHTFPWGMTMLRFFVSFNQETTLKFIFDDVVPVDFIFLTVGQVDYYSEGVPKTPLKSYQNIIIHYRNKTENNFVFNKNTKVKINFLQVIPEQYLKTKNHNFNQLNEHLKKIFTNSHDEVYNHFGNFNLQIADQFNQLDNIPYDGIIRAMIMEGHLNIILGLQILEHENFVNQKRLPEAISEKDIEKIQKASDYIQKNISENYSVADLAKYVMMSTQKLQLGFKLLYTQTVNEYIKEARLQKACDYLKEGHYFVSEIVYKVGYNNRSYFSKIFNERFGMLPSAFRNNLK